MDTSHFPSIDLINPETYSLLKSPQIFSFLNHFSTPKTLVGPGGRLSTPPGSPGSPHLGHEPLQRFVLPMGPRRRNTGLQPLLAMASNLIDRLEKRIDGEV